MRTYKRRGWAWKAASRLRWHTVRQDGRGRYHVEPMTQHEKEQAIRGLQFNECIREVFRERIEQEFNRPSVIRL